MDTVIAAHARHERAVAQTHFRRLVAANRAAIWPDGDPIRAAELAAARERMSVGMRNTTAAFRTLGESAQRVTDALAAFGVADRNKFRQQLAPDRTQES
jgi:hypothetical protein